MRVVHHTHPYFLEPALEFTRVMAPRTEFHLVIELTPRSLGTLLPSTPSGLPVGTMDGREVLGRLLPPSIAATWAAARSVQLVVYGNARTVAPATIPTSRAALRMIDELEPDALHLDDGSLRLAMAAPWLPRITLMNVHDPVQHGGDANHRIALARRIVRRRVHRFRLFNEAQAPAFRSSAGLGSARVVSIPLGPYDLLRGLAPTAAGHEERLVLFAGRLTPYKGLEALYAAAPAIAAQVPGVRIVVAGRPIPGYLLPAPPDLPGGGRVEVRMGHVPNDELAALYQAATVVVCPYRDATQSGVVMSAFAFDTPVVATPVGGLPEYVRDGETGLLVAPGDPAALADAVVRVLTERGLRGRLAAGIDAARHGRLSWSSIADRVMTAYAGD